MRDTTNEVPAIREIREAVKEFERTQDLHAQFGAADTEPDGEFQVLLVKAARGDKFKALTVREWQIFSAEALGRPGAGNAKNHLNRTAREACRLVRKHRHDTRVQSWVRDYCWRI